MLFTAVVAVCVASHAVASAATVPLPQKVYYDLEDAENLFKEHVKEYQKKYDAIEYKKRLAAFKIKLEKINKLNAEHPGTVFGITQFTDMTPEEVKKSYGFKLSNRIINNKQKLSLNVESKNVPHSFDWRDHGVVSPVKNQGRCGSCYIFSAIGNIEGQYAIKHKQCIAFSEQQCLDCLHKYNCGGGFPDKVMNSLAKTAGCMKEQDYPYVYHDRQPCKENPHKAVAKVTRGIVLNITDAEDLKKKLYGIGPLSIGLDASDFSHYKGGILHPMKCSSDPTRACHAVLLVGYGEENGEKYWIIKDSYGAKAREHGYVRLLRGVNACGVEKDFAATAFVV